MSLQYVAEMPAVVYNARKSRELGKLAGVAGNERDAAAFLEAKLAADKELFESLEKMGSRLLKGLQLNKAEEIAKLVALAGGAGALGGAAGSAIVTNRAKEDAKEKINTALKAALGITVGTVALKQLRDRAKDDSMKIGSQDSAELLKVAAASQVAVETLRVARTTSDPALKEYSSKVAATAMAHVADLVGDLVL